jgi:hypothetical protein
VPSTCSSTNGFPAEKYSGALHLPWFFPGWFLLIVMTRENSHQLREKIALFQAHTQTRKQIFLCMVTAPGLLHNEHSLGLIYRTLTLDDLFG